MKILQLFQALLNFFVGFLMVKKQQCQTMNFIAFESCAGPQPG